MLFHGYLSFFQFFAIIGYLSWILVDDPKEKIFLFSKLVAVYKPKLQYSYIHQVYHECL